MEPTRTMERYRPLFIGGEWVEPVSGQTTDVIDPATEETVAKMAVGGTEDIEHAVAAAQGAYDEVWFDTPAKERGRMLLKLADAIEENNSEFARLESIDVGKPISTTGSQFAADCIRFFAAAARCPEGKPTQEYARGFTSSVRREPLGVTAGICPWNYPLSMAAWKIGPALAAGNTAIIKPASLTPLSTLYIAELAADILPAGVLNVVTGPGADIGGAICRHPDVRLVSLTGDIATGKRITVASADTLKRVHLELGGKAPVIVFDDADLAAVVESVKAHGYINSGQDCTAACRVIAGPKVYDELLSRLVPAVESIKVGPTSDPEVEMGPVVSAKQRESVKGFVERARSAGASVCTGGEEIQGKGFYYKPTVITDVEQKAEIVQSEVFGPVVTVQRFSDEEQAVAWANDVVYGLSSAIWTRDHQRVLRVSRRLHFGLVWVNTHMAETPEMPHGGYKQSGSGVDLSMYALEAYTQIKQVTSKLG